MSAYIEKSAKDQYNEKRAKYLILLVRLAGIEPTTLGFGGQYSIH
jgi:hypothetical protein